MKRLLFKNICIFLLGVTFSYMILGFTRMSLSFYFFPDYIAFDIVALMLLYSPLFLFGVNIISRIYSYIIYTFIAFIFLVNSTYFSQCGSMFHLGLFNYFGEGNTMFNISYVEWDKVAYFIIMLVLYIVPIELFNKFYKTERVGFISFIIGIMMILVISVSTIVINNISYKKYYKDNIETANTYSIEDGKNLALFMTKYLNTVSFDELGVLGFYKNDMGVHVFKRKITNNTQSSTITQTKAPEDFSMDQRLDATGLLEGYNVFTIMIETGMYQFIDEILTPTLYEIASKGLNFTNNYSKNKTANSELIAIMGSYPTGGIKYEYKQADPYSIYKLKIENPNTVPLSIGDSYYRSFFHDGAGLYARDSIMGQLGFDAWKHEFYSVHPKGAVRWDFDGSYEMDSDYLDYVLDDMYSISKPFYTFYTTLSTHGPYETPASEKGAKAFNDKLQLFIDRGYLDKYNERLEYFKSLYPDMDEKYFSYFRYVMCAMQNFDQALSKIIERLKDEGVFDKTLFVLYGDHEAYYHISTTNTGLARALTNSKEIYDVEQYKTILIMYNEKLSNAYRNAYSMDSNEKIEIDTFTSPYIIAPTVLDLLGIKYDSRYFYGESFFKFESIYDGIFYTNEYSAFFTDKIYSASPSTHRYVNDSLDDEAIRYIENLEREKLMKLANIDEYYSKWFSYKE